MEEARLIGTEPKWREGLGSREGGWTIDAVGMDVS